MKHSFTSRLARSLAFGVLALTLWHSGTGCEYVKESSVDSKTEAQGGKTLATTTTAPACFITTSLAQVESGRSYNIIFRGDNATSASYMMDGQEAAIPLNPQDLSAMVSIPKTAGEAQTYTILGEAKAADGKRGSCQATLAVREHTTDGCGGEADQALCSRLSKTCGTFSAANTCGLMQTVASCGSCGDGQTCTDNRCVTSGGGGCTAETDAQFCTRLQGSCGLLTAVDNCQHQRSVAGCTPCVQGQTCTDNRCVADGGNETCGNGTCAGGETHETCAADCPAGSETCGNGTCAGGETTATCPADCPASEVCGNDVCAGGETTATCADDCPAPETCGNGSCAGGETTATCPADCPAAGDTTPPTVEATRPSQGNLENVDASLDSIRVRFNEKMIPSTVTSTSFQVRKCDIDSGGTMETWSNCSSVSGAVGVMYPDSGNAYYNRTFKFTPGTALAVSKGYRVKVTTAVQNEAHLALANNYEFHFTTSSFSAADALAAAAVAKALGTSSTQQNTTTATTGTTAASPMCPGFGADDFLVNQVKFIIYTAKWDDGGSDLGLKAQPIGQGSGLPEITIYTDTEADLTDILEQGKINTKVYTYPSNIEASSKDFTKVKFKLTGNGDDLALGGVMIRASGWRCDPNATGRHGAAVALKTLYWNPWVRVWVEESHPVVISPSDSIVMYRGSVPDVSDAGMDEGWLYGRSPFETVTSTTHSRNSKDYTFDYGNTDDLSRGNSQTYGHTYFAIAQDNPNANGAGEAPRNSDDEVNEFGRYYGAMTNLTTNNIDPSDNTGGFALVHTGSDGVLFSSFMAHLFRATYTDGAAYPFYGYRAHLPETPRWIDDEEIVPFTADWTAPGTFVNIGNPSFPDSTASRAYQYFEWCTQRDDPGQ